MGLCKDFGSIVKFFDWGFVVRSCLFFCRDFYVFFSGFLRQEVDIQGIEKRDFVKTKMKRFKNLGCGGRVVET